MVTSRRWTYSLDAEFGPCNISSDIEALVADAGISTGVVAIQLTGSTGALTTIEYEPGALRDLRRLLDQIAPANDDYEHNEAYHDGNGFSHVRSALLGTDLSIPIIDGKLQIGTWQEVLLLNLDNRKRRREVVAVVYGE
jgi:secondary thiamine-phosphate synthase enzyme